MIKGVFAILVLSSTLIYKIYQQNFTFACHETDTYLLLTSGIDRWNLFEKS